MSLLWSLQSFHCLNLVFQPEIFPTLQRDWHVSVLPEKIMEGALVERRTLLALCARQKIVDKQFTNLIRDRLSRCGRKRCRFGVRGRGIHWHRVFQVLGRL